MLSRRVFAAALLHGLAWPGLAAACSRVLWGDNGQAVVTGRSTDWVEDPATNLWALPRGIARAGLGGDPNPLAWTARHGSLVATFYDIATLEGMNETGLVANLLWLTEADFGARDPARPGLSAALWAQYLLDVAATVEEAVAALRDPAIQVLPMPRIPGTDSISTVHLALSDATGDSAVVEIVEGGRLRIHHGRDVAVMTNSPPLPQQIANLRRYRDFGGDLPLPGSSDPADRYVRATWHLRHLPAPRDAREAVAGVLSVMRNVAQPFTRSTDPAHPEAAGTYWRSVLDSTNRVYVFDSAVRPNVVWVRLAGLDLAAGAAVRKLDLVGGGDRVGDVTDDFQPATPFAFHNGLAAAR